MTDKTSGGLPRKNIAVILASGIGQRSEFSRPKQLMKLGGRPVMAHALARFQSHDGIDEIVIVTNAICLGEVEDLVSRESFSKVTRVLLGGAERYESSLAAIRAFEAESETSDLRLLFHDAVRPWVSHTIIDNVLEALNYYEAVDVALSVPDTVVLADPSSNRIMEIADRQFVRLGQTPQGFTYRVIREAYELALRDPAFVTTDDCGVVLKYLPQTPVYVVPGESANMKLTFAEDLLILDKFMQCQAARSIAVEGGRLRLAGLRDKVVVIIGGTSGIGASMAKIAEAHGAKIELGGRSTGVDVRDGPAIAAWLQGIRDKHGRIDAVINSAAVLDRRPLASMSLEHIAESIEINFTGAVNVAWSSFAHLSETRGHLMLFASSSYTYGRALYSTYSASKAAVVNLTQALADEWSPAGIKVNCVNPERARTPMRVKAFGNEPPETLLDPEEVAWKALDILTGDTSGIIYDIIKG
ncbi:MAG TPA: bifunctional cytidylyltransferase/SDR family oxidoreductase [Sphingomicrobium sp.]